MSSPAWIGIRTPARSKIHSRTGCDDGSTKGGGTPKKIRTAIRISYAHSRILYVNIATMIPHTRYIHSSTLLPSVSHRKSTIPYQTCVVGCSGGSHNTPSIWRLTLSFFFPTSFTRLGGRTPGSSGGPLFSPEDPDLATLATGKEKKKARGDCSLRST
ncbi:hypothetical protein BGZ63DRAFT_385507, partial [Mariannaea sp. PMI_226]